MPNSHPEICASPNSLLTFCPPDISLNFSDSIHQDIWAIVEKISKEKNQRGIDGKEKKIKRPRHEKKRKRGKNIHKIEPICFPPSLFYPSK